MRTAAIKQVSAVWLQDEKSSEIEISLCYHTAEPIEGLVAGIMIHNADGEVIYGTNTSIENVEVKTGSAADGRVAFVLGCNLASGLYFVTAAFAPQQCPGSHY